MAYIRGRLCLVYNAAVAKQISVGGALFLEKNCMIYISTGSIMMSTHALASYFLSMLMYLIFRLDHTCWPTVALLFAVFSLGALFDPARPPFSIESEEYYLLSRVTLINFAAPIFKTTITAVLTLVCVGL